MSLVFFDFQRKSGPPLPLSPLALLMTERAQQPAWLSLAVTVAKRCAPGASHAAFFTARSAGIHLVQAIVRHVANHAHKGK
jgi:hypothetical protein